MSGCCPPGASTARRTRANCRTLWPVHRRAVQGPREHHLDSRRRPARPREAGAGCLAGNGQRDCHRGLRAGGLRPVLMTYHTFGPDSASEVLSRRTPGSTFTAIQSSHGDRRPELENDEQDYQRLPTKPVIDLETTYPELVILKGMKPGNDDHARRSAYWAVFAAPLGTPTATTPSGKCMLQAASRSSNAKTDWRRRSTRPARRRWAICAG